MASPERPTRRDFLKGASALVLGAIVPKGAKSAESEPKQTEHKESPEQLKDRNTTIGLEIGILNSFDETDIELLIKEGKLPVDKIFQFTKGYHNAMAAAVGTTVVTAGALGMTGLLMKNQSDKNKSPQVINIDTGRETASDNNKIRLAVGASFLSALVAGFALKNIIYNQPSLQNIKNAEENVQKWLTMLRSNEKFYATRDSVMQAKRDRVSELTDELMGNAN
ncbi:MAG: twin-arginine translocation signal domain-containing protein [bacterium]|nr:twin-arginine translocation signal domain-containing protein [bacterium]